jgi:hypothetical protein
MSESKRRKKSKRYGYGLDLNSNVEPTRKFSFLDLKIQGASPELSASGIAKLAPFGFFGNLVGGLPLFCAFSLQAHHISQSHRRNAN